MDLNSSSIVKGVVNKVRWLLFVILLLEIGCWVGMSMLIGGYYAFWLLVGICFLGWIVGQFAHVPQNDRLAFIKSPVKLISILLIIPLWLTKLVALVVVIPPVRNALIRLVARKFMPKEVRDVFDENQPGLGNLFQNVMGQQNASPYAQMFNARQDAASRSSKSNQDEEIIDVDYEVKKSQKDMTTVKVNRDDEPYPVSGHKSLASEDDVIDVPYEWK